MFRTEASEARARMRVAEGDITALAVDAIVNAANQGLRRGGGVCGAIHGAAGPELEAECLQLGGCAVGEAKLTAGYRLPARHVIHTVGPVWRGGDQGEDRLLASCYRRSLELAAENGLRTVAFPAISTGIFGYPSGRAAPIAVETVAEMLAARRGLEVTFCCFGPDSTALHERALAQPATAQEPGRRSP